MSLPKIQIVSHIFVDRGRNDDYLRRHQKARNRIRHIHRRERQILNLSLTMPRTEGQRYAVWKEHHSRGQKFIDRAAKLVDHNGDVFCAYFPKKLSSKIVSDATIQCELLKNKIWPHRNLKDGKQCRKDYDALRGQLRVKHLGVVRNYNQRCFILKETMDPAYLPFMEHPAIRDLFQVCMKNMKHRFISLLGFG
jgi:hypothetical protein